jgi:threonine dehydratase
MPRALGRSDVEAAATRLRPHVIRTPVLRNPVLDEIAGAELWLKAECLQHIGAFKARGAMNAALLLSRAERARGLITYSSGNHAQAVALAAQRLGVGATIAMPVDAPPIKVAAVERLGAEVVKVGTTSLERRARAFELAAETGGAIIEPFDHPHTVCGQGTATLELESQVREAGGAPLEALIVGCGGGGLLTGACLVADPEVALYGVEPVGCDSLGKSLAAGEVVGVEPGPTIADGLKPTRIGELNFAIMKERLAGAFTVDDGELGRAMVQLLLSVKVLVEPSGAAALASALRRDLPGSPRRVGVMLTGGNVAPERIAELLGEHPGW